MGPRQQLAFAALAFVASALFAPAARTCSVCGCGDPLLSANDAAPAVGQLRLDLTAEYLTASARSDDDPAVTERLAQTSFKLVMAWGPFRWLNVVLQIPVTYKQWIASGGADTRRTDNAGLGDVELGGRVFVFQNTDLERLSRQSVGIIGGVSFPTGPEAETLNGQRIDQHAQIGTGAFGPYLGVQYRYSRDPWNGFASVSVRTHSINPYGYRFGDALLWSLQAQFRPIDRLAISVGLDGRLAGRDNSQGAWLENTGGLVLAASPGVLVNVYDKLWLTARVQIPFYTLLYGEQRLGPTFMAGVQYQVL